jgi:LacI family transcriptional regulator
VPVVCVNTDAPGTPRLSAVVVDPLANGSLVGELMGRFLQGRGPVMAVTGRLTTIDHARKVDGFTQTIRDLWPDVEIAGIVEAHDDVAEAYAKCRALVVRNPELAGAYVSTANSIPVLQALEDEGLAGKVTLITTDLFPDLVPHIRSGHVAATIHQRPWTQGRIVFQTLHQYLAAGIAPPPFIPLSPQIVMKSNLGLFLDRIRSGWGEEAEEFPAHEEGESTESGESVPLRARGSRSSS